jgi:hypothetical protein
VKGVNVDGRIILKWTLRKKDGREVTALIWLRDKRRALVNTVMKFGFYEI